MMARLAAAGLMAMTMGCTTVPDEEEPRIIEGSCNAAPVQNLVGQPASAELGRTAMQRASADTLRWIRPGDAITMDYLTGRLNIELDARGRVQRLYCG
jgi:hypothetical protein